MEQIRTNYANLPKKSPREKTLIAASASLEHFFSNKTLVAKFVMDMPTIADKIVHRPVQTEKVPCLITLKSEEQRISVEASMHRANAVPSDPLSHHGVTTTKTHAEAPLL